MSEPSKLDKWDKKIIYELDKNSRATLSEIGKGIGKSKSFVHLRLDNLEKKGIIPNYFLLYDYSRLGIESRSVFLKIFNNRAINEIIEYLRKLNIVSAIYETTGEFKLMFSVKTKNSNELTSFLENLLIDFNDDIKSYMIVLSYKSYSPACNYLYEDDMKRIEKVKEYNNNEVIDLSKKEFNLFEILRSNPRMSMFELSKRLKVDSRQVKVHYNTLFDKGIIFDIRPNIDSTKLGYVKKIFIIKLTIKGFLHLEELKKYLLEKKELIHLSITMGSADMFFTVSFKDHSEYKAFEDSFMHKFRDIISKEIILDYNENYYNVQISLK